jgi:predicted nucleic acid-binding Zn ribbon protein
MSDPPKKKPPAAPSLGDIVSRVLEQAGLAERVEQASVIPEWPGLVGPTIAAVTEPQAITADGTLFVAVKTHAWMNELSLMEPDLLRALNATEGRPRIQRIRMRIMR